MDFEILEESELSESDLLAQREAKKPRTKAETGPSPMILHIDAPPAYKMPKWNPTASKAVTITVEEFRAKRWPAEMSEDQIMMEREKSRDMEPPDKGYPKHAFLVDMHAGGVKFARLKRDIWRGEKHLNVESMPHTWMLNNVDYIPSQYEEYRYGSILDAEWIVKHCYAVAERASPPEATSQRITVFSGKWLSLFPTVRAKHWAWNPKYADKPCWNHMHLSLERWSFYESVGKELHAPESEYVCEIVSCNCFINGKHATTKAEYWVPDKMFAGSKLWFRDMKQDGYTTRQVTVKSKNGEFIEALPNYSAPWVEVYGFPVKTPK